MTEAQIKHMIDRFLGWKLPADFAPDGGVEFHARGNAGTSYEYKHEPVGTNLLTAVQAEAMVRYMLEGLPEDSASAAKDAEIARLREALELAEKSEHDHMNCPCCVGEIQAELCETCFPAADKARLARWKALGMIDIEAKIIPFRRAALKEASHG